jgi:competence protein ComEC
MKKDIIGIVIVVSTFLVGYIVYSSHIPDMLRVSFLDVGQGDAIFIQSPSGVQVLIDGGATKQVLEKLHDVMPLFDQSIDMVIATHPDLDHIGGLTDVMNHFSVKIFLDPDAKNTGGAQDILNAKLVQNKINRIIARRGQVYDLGAGVMLTILFPYDDVSTTDTNDASIVARLTYGTHSFLLTGDAPVSTEYVLSAIDGKNIQSDVLKLGHHGSNTSTSESFLEVVQPKWSIVSAGKDNSYGHPHQEVVDRVSKFKSEILNTASEGTITFESTGETITVLP